MLGGANRSYAMCLAPDNQFTLYRNDCGYSPIASTDFEWQTDKSYQLHITAKGNRIHAQVDDGTNQADLNFEDISPYLSGQIGLCTWHGSHTQFNSVSISAISEDGNHG